MAINGQIDHAVHEHRYELRNRYIFRGKLVMQTALHIGGGKVTLSSSDSPVVLTPDQKPFIPGSSFKGALRSTVEKLASTLPGFSTCALIEYTRDTWAAEQKEGRDIEDICPTVRQWHITDRRRNNQSQAQTAEINRKAMEKLCDTCRLFGSPFTAARLNVSDLYIPEEEWNGIIETRDGVAIDRDSEKARDRLKYDFEVVPASAVFTMEIVLENAEPADLQLICVGLSEYEQGFGVIGGKRSRGLGVAKLEGLTVNALELMGKNINETERRRRLQDYLVNRKFTPGSFTSSDFLTIHINGIFE
jgi:CRISPR-associated RAMP protein (TIGR02581 family)